MQHFPYAVDQRWGPMFKILGLKEGDGVTIVDDELKASYGWFTVCTPLNNVAGTQIDGPHRWYTAVGVRLSFADDGLTFGTNHKRGLCIEFSDKIPKVIGFGDHSTLWVSVADPEALAAALPGGVNQSG